MIITGTLLKPDSTPWARQSVRITSVLTAGSILRTADAEFKTDDAGHYSVTVPVGLYRVSALTSDRGYVDIGMITVAPNVSPATLNELIMVQQTTAPRDPLVDQIQQMISDFEAGAPANEPETDFLALYLLARG